MAYTEGNAPIGPPGEDLQFTPKQIRNGADVGEPGVNTADRDEGPMPDVGGLVDESKSAGDAYGSLGVKVWSGGDLDSADMTVGEQSFKPGESTGV